MFKLKLALLFSVIAGLFVLPAAASADCTLPTASNDYIDGADAITISGNFGPELNGKFVQIPFDIPVEGTGMRIRYCYEEAVSNPATPAPTLDLGVYEPNAASPGTFTMAQRRGWSGSAIRVVGIGVNGFTDPATYEAGRKDYVPGRTTRAFQPGAIPDGQWAVELGAGYIDPAQAGGVDWTVEVTPSTDTAWADEPYQADNYTPGIANTAAGWYTGDLHVHGEQEPGNALTSSTADLAFTAPPAGVGLDFFTLVDHNNDVTRSQIGSIQDDHPGKLIIPGTEVTTYDGHLNSQNSNEFVDFRLGEVKKLVGGNLVDVRGPEDPSDRFGRINTAGGWGQINHPTIFETAPAQCRGCLWGYSDARTDFSKVDAIELQTGVAAPTIGGNTFANPFTASAIAFYERALASGAHIAAVGSSDDHQANDTPDGFDSVLGEGATVVYADQLSQAGITAAVKDGHTYVKPFGPDAPDVEMKAGRPDKVELTAIPGDSVTLKGGHHLDPNGPPVMNIQFEVTGADSGVRPGPYTLEVLQDGIPVDSVPVTGGIFNHNYQTSESGRYSFKLTRLQGTQAMVEGYSTPIWFTALPADPTCETDPSLCPAPTASNKFAFKGVKLNRKKGTAALKVKVVSPGKVTLTSKNVVKKTVQVKRANQVVTLAIKPKGKLKKTLRKRGKASVKVKVTNRPAGGKALTKSKAVKLKQKKAKRTK